MTILRGLASWMSTYGDSVHGATASPYATDPAWGRATKKDGKLFAHVFSWPTNGVLQIPALTNPISRVYLLNNPSASLPYTVGGGQISVTVPTTAPDAADSVVCVVVSGVPASAGGARVSAYQDVNYSAASAVLPLGTYTSSQLSAAGVGPSAISSLRVPAGYPVTGYSGDNFTGTAWTFTADNPDLRATGNNDAIVSLKVTFNPAIVLPADQRHGRPGPGQWRQRRAAARNLKQWAPVDSANLQWQAVDLGNGYYKLVNRTNGMVADGWGSTTDGAPAQQAAWNGGPHQQWQITDRGNAQYSIANRTTGLALDGGGTSRLRLRGQAVDLGEQPQPAVDVPGRLLTYGTSRTSGVAPG